MLTKNEELYGCANEVSLWYVHGWHLVLALCELNEVVARGQMSNL
jgi:hypothetical protein